MSRCENCDLDYLFKEAMKGRDFWLSIKRKYKINEEWCLVILADDDEDLRNEALDAVPEYLNRKYLNKALLMERYSYNSINKNNIADGRIVIELVSDENMNSLLRYYKLNQIFKNVVVVSLKEPFGTSGIIGKRGINLDDYVRDALFV